MNPTIHQYQALAYAPEEALTQLTRCLGDLHAARGRINLERGERDLARADLAESLRHDPSNADAHQLRGLIERHHPAGSGLSPAEGDGPGGETASQPRTRFEAGYQVWARYPENPDRNDDSLVTPYPLTPKGLKDAIEYAKHMCSDASWSRRSDLFDAYWTGGVDFDAVVVEFRSLAREVHLEKGPFDDDPEGELA